MKQKSSILIDGSNFYFKLKDIGFQQLVEFDFSAFSKMLCEKTKLITTKYYVGRIRTDGSVKSQQLFNQQRQLLSHLRKHSVTYKLGYLLKSDGVFHEKGVDVQIAVDIVCQSYENQTDNFFLVSSDSDLIPAVEVAQAQGKVVTYVGFKHKSSYSLLQTCRRSILLTKDDLEPFVHAS